MHVSVDYRVQALRRRLPVAEQGGIMPVFWHAAGIDVDDDGTIEWWLDDVHDTTMTNASVTETNVAALPTFQKIARLLRTPQRQALEAAFVLGGGGAVLALVEELP